MDGEGKGDPEQLSPPVMGVIPNAEAAKLVGRVRRMIPVLCAEFARVISTGRRGDGDVP